MTGLLERLAGAPISWGVCEVPGWGHQLQPGRVLGEMARLGLHATELGPDGFLPSEPAALRDLLARFGLRLAAGFVPATLHLRDRLDDELASVERKARTLAAGGARTLVLAAASGTDGYKGMDGLSPAEWKSLIDGIDRIEEIGDRHGLQITLHPHYGTVIEASDSIYQLLADSDVSLCLDTGHVMVGGGDPVALAEEAATRVAHVHLKDVDAKLASGVQAGSHGYQAATTAGMYRPLGEGDVDLIRIVEILEEAGYRGWYVLEQDTVLDGEPADGAGPVTDVATSFDFLRRLAARLEK